MLLFDIQLRPQAALVLTAATALSETISHGAPQLLCFISIACNLGSTIGSTTLLTRFQNVNAMRLAWFEGGALFIMALSAPSAWLRWGIVTFVGALVTHLWATQPLLTNAVVLVLVAIQFVVYVHQSYAFWDDSQCCNVPRPLRIDHYLGGDQGFCQNSTRKPSGSQMPCSIDMA
jgi:hypothetical protein